MIAERAQFSPPPSADDDGRARTIRIALLGCGTVGGAAANILAEARARLRRTHGVDLVVVAVLVRDARRARPGVDSSLLTDDFEQALRARPDIAIEALGGREPTFTFVRRLLERGVSVVSANKTLIAHDGPQLEAVARANGARLAYEASVGAAIPVLAALKQRGGDPVIALRAVLNGTCNFILSRMRENGSPLDAIVREAVESGFAEPDPSADISGRDTAEKLCILARAAGFGHITPGDIPTSGIESITPRDLDAAREHGCVVRLVAELETTGDDQPPRLRVGPMLVPVSHPLARAKGAENVFVLDQECAGRLVLQGKGAGPRPTAAAILGDLLNVLNAPASAPAQPAMRSQRPESAGQPPAARRSFVRISRSHEAAPALRGFATQIHLRRDAIEMIVEGADTALVAKDGFVAAVLD